MTARDVAISRAAVDRRRRHPRRHAVGHQPAERRERAQAPSKTAPPVISRTTSTGAPPLASRSASLSLVGRRSPPTRGRRRRPAPGPGRACPAVDAVAMTRPAPISLGQLDGQAAHPAGRGHARRTDSPGARWALVRSRCQAVVPCSTRASAVRVVDRVGQRERRGRVGQRLLGVAAAGRAGRPRARRRRSADRPRRPARAAASGGPGSRPRSGGCRRS